MFVGGGVDYHLRPIEVEDCAHTRLITDIHHQRHNRLGGVICSQFTINIKQRKFRALNQQDTGGRKALHLPGQFGTD